jgi:hypothetical protein
MQWRGVAMTRTLAGSVIVIGLIGASSRADAAPEIEIYGIPCSGNGMLYDGAMPGEQQFGFYTIVNNGTTTLTVTDMAITGPGGSLIAFQDDPLCGSSNHCAQTFTVAPGELRGFPLTCMAPQPGIFEATLAITSDAVAGTGTIPFPVKGFYPPVLQVTPTALDFGTQHVCWQLETCGPRCATQPATQTLVITNAAPAPSEIDLDTILPPTGFFESFTIDSDQSPVYVLAAGQSVHITFTYHPMRPNQVDFDRPLTFTPRYPAGLAPVDVPFHAKSGGGGFAMDTPDPAGGIGPVGQPLVTTVTGHNAGESCLYLNEFDIWGADFAFNPQLSLNNPWLLQAGESITWTVTTTPTSVQSACYTLHVGFWYDEPESGSFYTFCRGGLGGALAADPSVGFDDVGVGMSATRRLRVSNAGNQPTDLTAMTSSDPHVTVALASGSLPVTLAPGDTTDIDVTFAPTDTEYIDTPVLLDGSNGDDLTLEVFGRGVLVAAGAAPASHDFGVVAYPSTPAQDFELHNAGERTLTVRAVTLDAPNDFALAGLDPGATLDPGGSLTFSVRAAPSMLGRRRATLSIDLDGAPDLAIPLTALAIDPALVVTTADPTPTDGALELGRVDVDVSRTGHITLHNAGSASITLAGCALAGDPAFTLAAPCPLTLAASADADLAIAFAPTAEADATATLTVSGTGFATGALALALHGIGSDQHIALSATSVTFPATFRHPATIPTQVVTLRNTAATELALSAITVDGPGFTVLGPATATLAPDTSIDITVGFSPSAVGDFTGQLLLANADDPQIARITLAGHGIARDLAIAPLTLDLGTVAVGATLRLGDLQPGAITLHNTDPTATFTLSNLSLTGAPAFHLVGPDHTILTPGDTAHLDLELTPTSPGALTAQIDVFADSDPDPIAQIAITAQAVAAPGPGGGCSSSHPSGALPLALALLLLRCAAHARRRGAGRAWIRFPRTGPGAQRVRAARLASADGRSTARKVRYYLITETHVAVAPAEHRRPDARGSQHGRASLGPAARRSPLAVGREHQSKAWVPGPRKSQADPGNCNLARDDTLGPAHLDRSPRTRASASARLRHRRGARPPAPWSSPAAPR